MAIYNKYGIFENAQLLNESKMFEPIILEGGQFITDCSVFVNEQVINECFGNKDFIRQSALLEGAKFNAFLQNFMKEGKDYKNLKSMLKEIVDANNMDKDELKSGSSKFLHTCKRIIQVLYDLDAAFAVGGVVGSTAGAIGFLVAGMSPAIFIGYIIGFIIGFIINRLIRFLVDTIEFDVIAKDCRTIVKDLRSKAKDCNDEKAAQKFNDEADRLEKALNEKSK